MPYARTSPPSDRFFARLDKFEAECPTCGKLLYATLDRRSYRARLTAKGHVARNSLWNPCTQRLKCRWCGTVYMAGLLLHPVAPGLKAIVDPPPDVVPSAREVAVSRQKAQGWWATKTYQRGQPVNVAVVSPCSCPQKGWSVACPVHGDTAQLRVP
jgi:hypothetical protein